MKRHISPEVLVVAAISFVGIGLQSRRLNFFEENLSLQRSRHESLDRDASFLSQRIDLLEKSLEEPRPTRKLQNKDALDKKTMKKDYLMLKKALESIEARMDSMEKLSVDIGQDRSLTESPFQKVGDWWVAQSTMFRFPKGIVIGRNNNYCNYGDAVLSVDYGWEGEAANCPSGNGSVAFGLANYATGDFATVTGGKFNEASGTSSAAMGGRLNNVIGDSAIVMGGELNTATGEYASVVGGDNNEAAGWSSAVTGGGNNKASGPYSAVTGGESNNAAEKYTSVTGGSKNDANGELSCITGGTENTVTEEGKYSSISGGKANLVNKESTTGGNFESTIEDRLKDLEVNNPFICEEKNCVSVNKRFKFTSDITVKGKIQEQRRGTKKNNSSN